MMEKTLVNEFLESLRRKGRNPATVAGYGRSLAEYADYLTGCSAFSHSAGSGQAFFAASPETVTGYTQAVSRRTGMSGRRRAKHDPQGAEQDAERNGKKNSEKTVWKKLHAVHVFYEWLKNTGHILLNPFPNPKCSPGNQLPRHVPCTAVLDRVYKKLRESPKLPEQRDYALIDIAYSCGLRRCELNRLDIGDICAEDGTIRVQGKRGKERIVPVGPTTLADLQYYIYHIRPKMLKGGVTNAVFVSWMRGGKRMHLYSINAAFRRLRKRYGFDKTLVPHGLRHAFATDLIKSGAPVQDVAEMLGHVKLETTQIYTRLAVVDLKKHHKMHHPRV